MTIQERRDLLDAVTAMVLEDYGEAPDDDQFNPFSPADVARQGVIMLQASYKEFEDIDNIAESLLAEHSLLGMDSDNLNLDEVDL